jgi:hypothetical protein
MSRRPGLTNNADTFAVGIVAETVEEALLLARAWFPAYVARPEGA